MSGPGNKKTKKTKESTPVKNENSQSASNNTIAPHYDTQVRSSDVNVEVEISKGSIVDSYETDSKPRGT